MSMRSMMVEKSEKRSWMALWQLQRLPRRITQALDATDCQQDRREAVWMAHTYISVDVPPVNWCLFHLFLFHVFFFSTVLVFSLVFHFGNFPSLCPASLLSLALPNGSERRGHRQVTYAPSLGLLLLAYLTSPGMGGAVGPKKLTYKRGDMTISSVVLTHISHLSLLNQQETSVLATAGPPVSVFCHSHILKRLSHSS